MAMSLSKNNSELGNVVPTTDSDVAEERIAARRLRIHKRADAARRAALGEPEEEEAAAEEQRVSEAQIFRSEARLTKLTDDGNELITNIRIAIDSREYARRIEEDESRRQRRDKIDAEQKSFNEKFKEISGKWESALQKEIPQHLMEMLAQQQEACNNIVDEKNKLIKEFQTELKQLEDYYVRDLKRQAEDIDLLIERMEEQVSVMVNAYKAELLQIERSFEAERGEVVRLHRDTWEQNAGERSSREERYLKERAEKVDEYENELEALRTLDQEEYNAVKIKHETNVQLLEQQLQQMKATYQLNQEKLDYNWQVLKKRDEENAVTKNQQKRKITRLQDIFNKLKQKHEKQEKTFVEENDALTGDYLRVQDLLNQLLQKSQHFLASDAEKFRDVWILNEGECKRLVTRIMDINTVLFQQQLGREYSPASDTQFLNSTGPLCPRLQERRAGDVAQEILATPEEHLEADDASENSVSLSAKTVKQVLELLCDESGFLLETKLFNLLGTLVHDEQTLVKLDNVFAALGIVTESDIKAAARYFVKLRSENSAVNASCGDEANGGMKVRDEATGQLVDFIHPNDVLKCLRQFAEEQRKSKQAGNEFVKPGQPNLMAESGMERRDNTSDAAHWKLYSSFLTAKEEKIWTAMGSSMEKYHDTLGARAALLTETDALRQQNGELRMLLQQYLHSNVNKDLVVPPTRVLQLDFN